MISKRDHWLLVGITHAGMRHREDADKMKNQLEKILKEVGASDSDAADWAGELIYNEGDNCTAAVDRVLDILKLEVEA